MPRQNPQLLSSSSNLRAAATTIRSAVTGGTFEDLKAALVAAATAFEQAEAGLNSMEQRLRDLGQANVNDPRRPTAMLVSGDRIRGGVQVQGGLRSVMGQGMDLTFASQVAHVTSMDHSTGGYLELDLDGLGITLNAHGGTISLTGTISLSAPLTVPMGGTGTATGSITGTGALTFTSGGTNTNITLLTNGTGKVVAKPGTDSATAFEVQTATGVAVVDADTTNHALGVTSTSTNAARGLTSSQFNTGIQAALVVLKKARGTVASPAVVASGDNVGQVQFQAYGTTMAFRAGLLAMVSAAPSVDSVPTDVAVYTGDGATTVERVRVTAGGKVLIGTATPGASILSIHGLPTSAAGLSTDDVWVDTGAGNVLKIV